MANQSYIRFVGGPKHNEILRAVLRPAIDFVATPPVSAMWSAAALGCEVADLLSACPTASDGE
jgi:hypothetical protein